MKGDMMKKNGLLLIVCCFLLNGCITQRGWRYTAENKISRSPLINKTVAVIPFQDSLPDKNSNAMLVYLIPLVPAGWCEYSTPESTTMKMNSSGTWQFRPTEDFAKAAAEELQASGLFKEVFFTQRESEGDLVLRGKIASTNYIGTIRSYGFSVYGPCLWFFGFPAGRVENEVAVELNLMDHNNISLWSNSYKREYKKPNVFLYSLPSDFQYDTLYKEIMLQAVKDMEDKFQVQ